MGITDKNMAVIDRMFINGFDRIEAWNSVYTDVNQTHVSRSVYQMLNRKNSKEYYNIKYEEFKQAISVDKYTMIDNLIRQVETFDDIISLAAKEKLTDIELDKLDRLTSLIKGADIMKAKDMICKLIGAYEPAKIEVKEVTYTVGFSDSENI